MLTNHNDLAGTFSLATGVAQDGASAHAVTDAESQNDWRLGGLGNDELQGGTFWRFAANPCTVKLAA